MAIRITIENTASESDVLFGHATKAGDVFSRYETFLSKGDLSVYELFNAMVRLMVAAGYHPRGIEDAIAEYEYLFKDLNEQVSHTALQSIEV